MTTIGENGLTMGSGAAVPGDMRPRLTPRPRSAIAASLPLIIRPAGTQVESVEIAPHDRLVVGSSDDADLTLPGMAPQHGVFYDSHGEWAFAIFTSGHSWLVVPGGDDESLFGPRTLHRGDRLKLGTMVLTVDPAS